jgi:hypothetical protein
MIQGLQLSLLVGPAVPLPAPRSVIEALTSVRVTVADTGPSAFQLSFKIDNKSPLQTLFLLAGGSTPPLLRVILVASFRGAAEVLIDGVMTHHEFQPGDRGSDATLTITGEDLTRVMDYIDFSGFPFPGMPPEARVALILAKYAFLGIAPLVIPSVLLDVPIPVDRIPLQQGKDLAYVRALADEVGYVFYIEPQAPGASLAYWGPEIKVGVPQPALNGDMDAFSNVQSLSFNLDTERAVTPLVYIHNQLTKVPIPIPIPPITPLNPPLGAVPPIPKNFEPLTATSKLSPVRAAVIGLTKAARTADVVRGTGSLDVLRYGRILKARRLVGVRGVGQPFDGLYYVKTVTHTIARGSYKQDFTLTRNGLLSTVPRVAA